MEVTDGAELLAFVIMLVAVVLVVVGVNELSNCIPLCFGGALGGGIDFA